MRSYYSACIYPLVSLVPSSHDWPSFSVSAPCVKSTGCQDPPGSRPLMVSPKGLSWAPFSMLGQLYADDVQAYQHYPASDALVTAGSISRTMEALGSGMSSNRLRLNPHKPQFIWLGPRQQLAKLDMVALTSAFPHFTFSSTVRDLGVTLDQELTLAPHIHSLCRACYYQLRQLRTVSRSLTSTAAATLVHSFVTSRLDYCSSLYIGLPATRLNCLNRVLRSAARLIGRVSKFDHISAYMRDVLHWLPLRQRIE